MFDGTGSIAWREFVQRESAIFTVALVLLVVWLVSRAASRLIERLRVLGHLGPVMARRLQIGRRWAVWTIAIPVLLQTSGLFQHAWALLSAVLAAVAIGFFAAWSIISNLTSALLIVALRPFRIGDDVELVEPGSGTSLGGRVVDMNLVFTTLTERNPETGVESRLHVPNNLFLQKLIRARPAHRGDRASFFGSQPPAGASTSAQEPRSDEPR